MSEPSETPKKSGEEVVEEPKDGRRPAIGDISPDFLTLYSNSVGIFKTAWDIRFDFSVVTGGLQPDPLRITKQASVLMSPQHAKVFLLLLIREIERWEKQFGDIKLADEVKKQLGIVSVGWDAQEIDDESDEAKKPSE